MLRLDVGNPQDARRRSSSSETAGVAQCSCRDPQELKTPNIAVSSFNPSRLPPPTCLRRFWIHAGNSLLQTYCLLASWTTGQCMLILYKTSLMTQNCRQVRTVRQIDTNADIRPYRHVLFRGSISISSKHREGKLCALKQVKARMKRLVARFRSHARTRIWDIATIVRGQTTRDASKCSRLMFIKWPMDETRCSSRSARSAAHTRDTDIDEGLSESQPRNLSC